MPAKMNVKATYRIESSPSGVRLVRDEDVLIAPPGFVPGKSRLFPTTLSLRRILQRKFGQLFPEVIDPEALVIPGPWEKAGPLSVVRMAADAGWLRMSWEMQSRRAGRIASGDGTVRISSLEEMP